MRRRRLLVGFAGLSLGGLGTIGTGAFTSVTAQRDAEVDLENDANAYLGLLEVGQGGRSTTENDLLKFEFPSDSEPSNVGLGSDSIYHFETDANSNQAGLFEVVNQGANTVEVYGESINDPGSPMVAIYDVSDPAKQILDGNPNSVALSPGDSFIGGMRIDTHDVPIKDDPYEVTLRLHAEV